MPSSDGKYIFVNNDEEVGYSQKIIKKCDEDYLQRLIISKQVIAASLPLLVNDRPTPSINITKFVYIIVTLGLVYLKILWFPNIRQQRFDITI
jgi:hypothetical protein